MSQQNINVKGAAEGPQNQFKGPESNVIADSVMVKGSVVGNCEEVAAYLKEFHPDETFAVIVWTREEIKTLATENDITITDDQADAALYDIALNETHEHGQNEESALSYIISSNNLE